MKRLEDLFPKIMSNAPILVVEDNPDDELLMMRSFKKNNIANEIVIARDGVEAIDYLFGRGMHEGRDPRQLPALILLDLKLPRVSGFEVLKEIRTNKITSLVPVVILTSSAEDKDIIEGYGLGANSYVRKPVDFEDFVEATGKLSVYWLLINRPAPVGNV